MTTLEKTPLSVTSVVILNYDNVSEDNLASLVTSVKESGRKLVLSIVVPQSNESILLDVLTTANYIKDVRVIHSSSLDGETMLSTLYKVQSFVDYAINTSTVQPEQLNIDLEFDVSPVIPVEQSVDFISNWLDVLKERK